MSFDARQRAMLFALLAVMLSLGLFYWLSSPGREESTAAPALVELDKEGSAQAPLTAPPAPEPDAPSHVVRAEASLPEASSAPSAPSAQVQPEEFLVEVVDHEDRPLRDVSVAVIVQFRGGSFGNMRIGSPNFRIPPEASEDLVRIPRLEVEKMFTHAREFSSTAPAKPSIEIAIECQHSAVQATRHVLANAEPPAETIRLKLAPAGRVRVEVRNSAGVLTQQALSAAMVRASAALPRQEALRAFAGGEIERATVKNGVAFFPYVGLEQLLQITVSDGAGLLRPEQVVIEGPREPQSEVVAQVLIGETNPVLVGRLVDAMNNPIAERMVGIVIVRANNRNGTSLQTDAEGNFERPWTDEFGAASTAEVLEFRWEADRPDSGDVPIGRLLCPPIPTTGRVDLGTIMLRPPTPASHALLVSGRVVDGTGAPLPLAGLSFYSIWPLVREGPWEENAALPGGLPRVTDEQGSFVAYVSELPRGVRVDARLEGYYFQSSLVCEPGRSDVEIVMRRGAVLRGKLLLDPAPDSNLITVSFADQKRIQATCSPDAEGNFELVGLRPGLGVLQVGIGSWPAALIEDIAIPEQAAEVEDKRCVSIDLRGAWRSWVFELDSGSLNAKRRSAGAYDPENADYSTWFYFEPLTEAVAWIPSSVEEIDLLFYGYLPLRLSYAAGTHIVKLDREPALIVELPTSFQIPEGFVLELRISAPPGAGFNALERRRITMGEVAFDARGRAEFRVPKSGAYLFRWQLRSKLDNRQELISEELESIELGTQSTSMTAKPPAEALARALAKWG